MIHMLAGSRPYHLLVTLGVLCFGSLLTLRGWFWDDNLWLQAAHASANLAEFLDAGFHELRREPQGAYLYSLLGLHGRIGTWAPFVWRLVALVVTCGSACLLYRFVRDAFGAPARVAFAVAAVFLVIRPDTTVPIVSNSFYRMGVLVALSSFCLTERAVTEVGVRKWIFSLGVISGAFAQYVLMEGVLFYEPARWLLLVLLLRSRLGLSVQVAAMRSLVLMVPFAVLAIPLMVHKTLFKPYGDYEGVYRATGPDDQSVASGLLYLVNHPVRNLKDAWGAAPQSTWWMVGLGLLAAGLLTAVFLSARPEQEDEVAPPKRGALAKVATRIFGGCLATTSLVILLAHSRFGARLGLQALGGTSFLTVCWVGLLYMGQVALWSDLRSHDGWIDYRQTWWERVRCDGEVLLFGGTIFFTPLLLYLTFGRVLGFGANSRHTLVLQIGYSILVGLALYRVLTFAGERWPRTALGLLVALVCTCVAANNASTAVYRTLATERAAFLRAFLARFPEAPPGVLLVEAYETMPGGRRSFGGYTYEHHVELDQGYDLECFLDLIYTNSTKPSEFRTVRAVVPTDLARSSGPLSRFHTVPTHWGPLEVDLTTVTFVRWRGGKLLVNEEIVRADPHAEYAKWANRPPPSRSPPPVGATYPLRGLVPGLR